MKVVIVAGGLATRLRPITSTTPKCLVDIFGKPLLHWVIDIFKKQGFTDFVFCVGYMADQVQNYFDDGKKFEVNIKYVVEETLMGTAGAVKQAERFLSDNFIVFYGDNLTTMDFHRLIKFHQKQQSVVTLCLRKTKFGEKTSNIVTMDSQDKVNTFIEKPDKKTRDRYVGSTGYISNGIYLCRTDLLNHIPARTKYDFSFDLFPDLLNRNLQVAGYCTNEFYRELGRTEKYHKFIGDRSSLKHLIVDKL